MPGIGLSIRGGGEDIEGMHRVRIGLTGLAFVFLLVLLGAAVSRWGAGEPGPNTVVEVNADAEPNEPLAELGVAPGESSVSNETQNEQ
jgi:hypothetical protein